MSVVEAAVSAAQSGRSLPVLVAAATVAGIPKLLVRNDLEFVEKGAEVYAKA